MGDQIVKFAERAPSPMVFQLLAGGALFIATAYALQQALLDKEAEWPERIALGLALAFLVPGLTLLLLNLAVRFPINTVSVYAAYAVVAGAALTRERWQRLLAKRLA
jgi:hypothetical protein